MSFSAAAAPEPPQIARKTPALLPGLFLCAEFFAFGTKTAPGATEKTRGALRKAHHNGGDEENRTPIRITTRGQNVRGIRTFHAIASDPCARCGHNVTKNGTKKIISFFCVWGFLYLIYSIYYKYKSKGGTRQ